MPKAKKLPPESVGDPLIWPPPGGTPLAVWPHDNWWTIMDVAGRSNVWDVILFNFNTINPLEINYYMRSKLGCFATKKGNWRFGQEDGSPSTIYLPPTGWKWLGIGQPQPPVRPAMAGRDQAVANHAINVLRGPIPSHIWFSQGPYRVAGSDFARIADRIANGTIAVFATDGNTGEAEYKPEEQALYLRDSLDAEDSAKIIHEAVHVAFDLNKKHNILTKEDEAMAYLAETIWIQELRNTDIRQLLLTGHDAIFQAAYILWRDKYKDGWDLTYDDFGPLRNAITASGHYGNVADHIAAYDGVYELAAV